MSTRIDNLVDLYFDEIPYSEQVSAARRNIKSALSSEYDNLECEGDKFDELVARYGKLSDMAALAGYGEDDIKKWRESGDAKSRKELGKELKRQRWKIYFIALFGVCILYELFWFVYNIVLLSAAAAVVFVAMAAFTVGECFLIRSFVRGEKRCENYKYDGKSYMYLRELADRYSKRRLNGIALAATCVTVFITALVLFFVFDNSKAAEVTESIITNMVFIGLPAVFCTKNRLCYDLVHRRLDSPYKDKYKKHVIAVSVFSSGYWALALMIMLLVKDELYYPGNMLIIAVVIFALCLFIYDAVWRKKIVYKNFVLNGRRVAIVTVAVFLVSGGFVLRRDTWYTQTYINSIPAVAHRNNAVSYDEETGVYTITAAEDDFRILHLTDIHLGGSLYSYRKDIKALRAVYAEIEYTKPDLVIVTGDLCFPLGIMSLSFNNSAPVNQFAAFMRNIGVPWAFTYGNHDTEGLSFNEAELNELYKSLSYKTSRNLLYPYVQPAITGRNNQLIELRNADGSFNTALFLIDSNAYTGAGINDYDYIHDDQVDWYAGEVGRLEERENRTVPSMAFFHIPLQEYRTAYELYLKGSDEVKYYFGENGEKMMDKICCSDYPSKLFDTIVELKSTQAVFCGHDHYNNMSLEYKGVRLTYGMSIDYLAMPGIEDDTAQRGGELITIRSDGSWTLEQIPLAKITG